MIKEHPQIFICITMDENVSLGIQSVPIKIQFDFLIMFLWQLGWVDSGGG